MCIKFIEWFNNDFLFMFESKKYKENKENKDTNYDELHHNIKIIIDEPKISPYNSNSVKPTESHESNESSDLEKPLYIGITNDKYDLYTSDIL